MSNRLANPPARMRRGIERDAAQPDVRTDGSAATRVSHLDFVKGTLVVVMVFYHWLNYFIGLQWGGYRYLRFLTPSFIFITGFLVSRVYLKRYSYDDPQLRRRLVWRGVKLLLLFTGLNLIVEQMIGGRLGLNFQDPSTFVNAAEAVFLRADARAVFDILVSIAYFLLLAPVLLLISQRLRIPLSVLAVIAVALVATASVMGRSNPHFEMLSIACLGLATGAGLSVRTEAALRSPVVLIPMYLIYLVAIARWNTPFLVQVVGVCLSLLLIDAVAVASGDGGVIQRRLIRMGQYSLLAYIAQIAVLQFLRRAVRVVPLDGPALVIPLLLGLVMTIVMVELMVVLRAKSTLVDRAYRAVFA